MTPPSENQTTRNKEETRQTFSQKVWVVVRIVTAVFITLFLLWIALTEVLAIFAGILLAVFLVGISKFLSERSFLSRKAALILIVTVIIASVSIIGMVLIPSLIDQSGRLLTEVRTSLDTIQETMSQTTVGQTILDQVSNMQSLNGNTASILSSASTIFSNTLDIFIRTVIVIFVGLFLAMEPKVYLRGLQKLVKQEERSRYRDIFDKAGYSLRWWLAGRIASMIIVGVLSIIGLMLLGVPLAMILGILAGLLAFIPFLGPTLALIPPMLIAFADSPQKAIYVFLLYMGIQFVESYLITPIIQRRATALPPVLLIGSQVLMGLLAGFWGVMLAAPLAIVGKIAVKRLYVEEILDDHSVQYLQDKRNDGEERDIATETDKKGSPSPVEQTT